MGTRQYVPLAAGEYADLVTHRLTIGVAQALDDHGLFGGSQAGSGNRVDIGLDGVETQHLRPRDKPEPTHILRERGKSGPHGHSRSADVCSAAGRTLNPALLDEERKKETDPLTSHTPQKS